MQLGIPSPLLGVTANEGEIAATPGHQKQQLQQQMLTQLNGMTSANNANTTTTTLANTKEKTPMCLVNELARFNKVSTLSVISGLFLKGGAHVGIVVKAPHYKLAGRGFDSRWCHWNFSVTQSFWSLCGSGVDSTSNRNEYQVYFLGVKAASA